MSADMTNKNKYTHLRKIHSLEEFLIVIQQCHAGSLKVKADL